MSVSPRSSLCQWFFACCLGLAACGGDGGGSGVGGSGGGPGTLSLTVTGLPSGTPATVTVTGPGAYRQAAGKEPLAQRRS